MKVLFSNPPWWIENPDAIYAPKLLAGVRAGSRWPFTTAVRSRPGAHVFGDYLPYPFFLGAAATYLARETGAAVAFRDSLALREGYPAYLDYLKAQDFDAIVIESASPSWEHDAGLIAHIKTLLPRTVIAVAGPIAVLGEKLLEAHPVDAVIQGEYEKGCVKVVEGARGLLPHDLLTEEEFDAAPYPYQDDLHAHRYWDANPKGQVPPQLQVMSSRGCPYKCIFCVWPAVMTGNDPDGQGQRLVRRHSADHMEGLLTDMIGRYGYKTVYFDDDTFNLGDRHVLALCDVMERIGLPWSAMCRADTISRDTWKRMRQAGCFGVKIGFESGNQQVIDTIVRKNLDLEKARETVRYLKDLGFTLHGTFTVGLPGETAAQRADTVRYRRSLPLDTYQESGTAEIEGAPLATLRRTGRLDRYAGASLEGYVGEGDGTSKFAQVALGGMTLEDAAGWRDKGNPALAEAICRNLMDSAGETAPVLDLLGLLAAEARQLDLATRFFSRAVQADARYAPACVHLGNLLRDQGLAGEAASCYRRALEIAPGNEEARLGLEWLQRAVAAAPGEALSPKAGAVSALPGTAWGRNLKKELGTVNGNGRAEAGTVPEAREAVEAGNGAGAPLGQEEAPGGGAVPGATRLIVLDHGMRFVAGHHLAYNLGLLVECMKRRLPVEFYVHADCKPEIVKVLKARAVLKPTQYVAHSSDKYCGYLEDFTIASKLVEFNLYKNLKGRIEPTDIVYVHTADPKIVMGIAAWYVSLTEDRRPYLCLKFQNHCYRYVTKEYKALVQSVFRMALKPFINLDKVHFAASNKLIAGQIRLLAEKPCPVFPIPLQLELPPRPYVPRAGKTALRIGYAGEGRAEQGVNMLPDIIEAILPVHPDVTFVIQLGCRFAEAETMRRLRAFGNRVVLLEQCYVGADFHKLVSTFDVLLLPYSPDRYIERSSQVVIEAIALGVPLLVPARTSLSLEAREFDCGHGLIQGYGVEPTVEALHRFLESYDEMARKSFVAGSRCAAFHCGGTLVTMLLDNCLGREYRAASVRLNP